MSKEERESGRERERKRGREGERQKGRERERGGEGKSVDLGGRRIVKKKTVEGREGKKDRSGCSPRH